MHRIRHAPLALLLALLLAAAPLWAHAPPEMPRASDAPAAKKAVVPLVIAGDTVTVVKSLPCTVTAPAGADLYFWSLPDGVTGTAEDNVLTVTAAPAGDSTISVLATTIAISVSKDGAVTKKTMKDKGSVVLTCGVKPPPPPVPPAPADPLTAAFQAAYAMDTDADKAKSLAFLAGVYKGLAGQAAARTDLTTNAAFIGWIRGVVGTPGTGLTATQVVKLRTAIGAELAKAWGTAVKPLTPTAAGLELAIIGNALSGVTPTKMGRAE